MHKCANGLSLLLMKNVSKVMTNWGAGVMGGLKGLQMAPQGLRVALEVAGDLKGVPGSFEGCGWPRGRGLTEGP
jgi:hypothetical protein